MRLACFVLGHDWNDCGRCGKKRNRGHDWDKGICRSCGLSEFSHKQAMEEKVDNQRYTVTCSSCGGNGLDPNSISYANGAGDNGCSPCPTCGGRGEI